MAIYHMGLRFPWTSIGSDAGAVVQVGVPDATGLPHPRSFGNHVRVIARYVKETKTLALEAVRKMTFWSATRVRLADRGSFKRPTEFPTGIEWVPVNGVVVIDRGRHTGAKPRHVLRGPGWPPAHATP